MGLINPAYAPEATFRRPDEDADGNRGWVALGNIKVVVELVGPGLMSGSGTSYAQGGTVFVPRSSGVMVGDHFAYGDAEYMLSGGPNGDQDHPFTGADFGWVSFTFIGPTANWGRN